MGWGNKFPTIQQLNALTKSPANRSATRAAFQELFPNPGDYKLGELCRRWDGTKTVRVGRKRYEAAPPWTLLPDSPDADHPWDDAEASDWANHCQSELGGGDVIEVDTTGRTTVSPKENIREKLEEWIVEAIQKDIRIIYRFKRKRHWSGWAARRRIIDGGTWKILVKGPGF